MQVTVNIINAFTINNTGGNPAGVVLNANGLTARQKQSVATKLGLSEIAFVSSSDIADYKLEFFTPARQIAHCGHATIATFSYLAQQGMLKSSHSSKETIEGIREILIKNDWAFMEQKPPAYESPGEYRHQIEISLGLSSHDILDDAPVSIVNTGNSFAIIPVKNATILKQLNPDLTLIKAISEKLNLIGYYVFTTDTMDINTHASARMFAPAYGINEEAATGMAAGPLACYLYDVLKIKKDILFIEQGLYMKEPSPSLITVELIIENNSIIKLMAGGKGTFVSSRVIEI